MERSSETQRTEQCYENSKNARIDCFGLRNKAPETQTNRHSRNVQTLCGIVFCTEKQRKAFAY